MNEATNEYTLADFQQQTAEKYGKNWDDLSYESTLNELEIHCNEAAEAYAAYRYEQGKQAGEAKGWNEALKWAAEHATCSIDTFKMLNGVRNKTLSYVNRDSILNGLKQEEE